MGLILVAPPATPPPAGSPPPAGGPPVVPVNPPSPGQPPVVGTPVKPGWGWDRFEKLVPNIEAISPSSVLKNAGLGALYGSVFSAFANTRAALRGEQTKAQAVGNVVGDAFTAALGGISFGIAGHFAMRGLSSALGLAGLPLAIGSMVAGTLGAVVTKQALGKVKKSIAANVALILGHKEPPVLLRVTPQNFDQVMRERKVSLRVPGLAG